MKILFLAVLFVFIGGCVAAPKRTSIGNSPEEIAEYRVGAEKGDAEFQKKLGVAYEYGRGVPQNNILAYMWFDLAITQGSEKISTAKDATKGRSRVTKK